MEVVPRKKNEAVVATAVYYKSERRCDQQNHELSPKT